MQSAGFHRADGQFCELEAVTLCDSKEFGASGAIGSALDLGHRKDLRLTLDVEAKSGTNPTLAVTVQTSRGENASGVHEWRTVGSFVTKTDVGLAMGAVSSTGTTPPTVTLSGTPDRIIDLRVECTTLGARGVSVIKYSIDGGVTYVADVTTAATINVLDTDGTDTGLVLNIATGNAAVDNVWTAKCVGRERKTFSGCDRFVRYVAAVGGSSTPTMTATLSGEAV